MLLSWPYIKILKSCFVYKIWDHSGPRGWQRSVRFGPFCTAFYCGVSICFFFFKDEYVCCGGYFLKYRWQFDSVLHGLSLIFSFLSSSFTSFTLWLLNWVFLLHTVNHTLYPRCLLNSFLLCVLLHRLHGFKATNTLYASPHAQWALRCRKYYRCRLAAPQKSHSVICTNRN